MAEDVDFVTVATTYPHGRADFEGFHPRLLSGRFKNSTNTVLQTTARFLDPDLAVVHWSWKIEGDRNMDGTMGQQPRYGMMTMVAERRKGTWLVVVAQNRNALLRCAARASGYQDAHPNSGNRREAPMIC